MYQNEDFNILLQPLNFIANVLNFTKLDLKS